MSDRQSQRAGDNSQLVQVAGDYHAGNLTFDQAKELAELAARKVLAEEFAKADAVAQQRMDALTDRVLRELDTLTKLGALRDPSFQVTFRKALLGAACTDTEADYDMLAQLLADRAERGAERKTRAGLDGAIEIVDKIDPHSLTGLTVFQAVLQYRTVQGSLSACLDTLDQLYGQLLDTDLPTDQDWLDHLDVLGTVRISSLGHLNPFDDIFSRVLVGLVSRGIQMGSENETDAFGRLSEAQLSLPMVEHELKPGFRRIALCGLDILERSLRDACVSEAQLSTALAVAKDDFGLGDRDDALIEAFGAEAATRPNIAKIRDWWGSVPRSIHVTAIGRVLARANAKRCDTLNMLPPLD